MVNYSKIEIAFIETSAFQAVNIDKAFQTMMENVFHKFTIPKNSNEQEQITEGHNIIELSNSREESDGNKKKKCC